MLCSWLRHLFTWVQQPSHGLLSLQPELPRGMIVLQSKGPDEEDPEEEELPLSSLLDDVASGCAATCTCVCPCESLHVRSQAENAATAGSPAVNRPPMLLHTGPGTEAAGQSEAIAIGE